ncbi:protein translocase SEC61 complex gamma subunit [Pilaira anomala]|nr:protein translocase SEC61 complex gamma subunit [Pilaira anomala]
MSSSDMKDTVQQVVDGPKQFMKEGVQFINRCKKPDQQEFLKITQAVAMGFAALGALGYFVKLIHIPINNILVGAA